MTSHEEEIINELKEFLRKSSAYYSTFVQRRKRDLMSLSGGWWNEERRKSWKRSKRQCLAVDNWQTIANAVVSPFSASPWHVQLAGDYTDIQDEINRIEFDADTKNELKEALYNAVNLGAGPICVTTIQKADGVSHIIVESIRNTAAVAFDPSCKSASCKDAEQCAIVNTMSLRKARREYGEDIVPNDYPRAANVLAGFGDQWNHDENEVFTITYYRKSGNGVEFFRFVGDKLVAEETLNISFIPVLRMTGYQVYRDDKWDYTGIVDRTEALTALTNIAYSSLAERLNRASKASVMAHVKSIEGLEKYYTQSHLDEAATLLWTGEHQPVPLSESFQTADLAETIKTTQSQIENQIGIPLSGVNGMSQNDKTATEILSQEAFKESNAAIFYSSARDVIKTIGEIIIELLTGGQSLEFELNAGPELITENYRHQRELNAMMPLVPENMKPVLLKYYAQTMESAYAEELSANIIANLPPEIKLLAEGSQEDPVAIHTINQLQQQFNEAMAQCEQYQKAAAEAQQQVTELQQALMDSREQRQQDWNKFIITERDKVMLETQKLTQSAETDATKIVVDEQKSIRDAEIEMAKLQQKHNEMLMEDGYV